MATEISAIGTPKKITLSATAGTATEVTLSGSAAALGARLTLYFETDAGRYSNAGSDDAAIGNDYEAIPADTPYDVMIDRQEHGDTPTFYVAGAGISTVVRVTAHAR